ncbi:hypothetical protein N7562_06695 [Acinetobacter soli]|uniref:hypothetical protein n=1 Tax=Acinetobacter soli TaxID=487316 RepID=UPI00287D800C|nr:hypothetical protein [Acinetobacter soli]MDS7693871.1 hypothetical protein [Acinetobacter soli]
MVDKTEISKPIEIKDNSVERVTFDLMSRIAEAERVTGKDEGKKDNPREYYLKLYNQCHKVVSWSGVNVKDVL